MSKVLMAVYNGLPYDGRVQRAAATLQAEHQVYLMGIESEVPFTMPDIHIETVSLPKWNRFRFLLLLVFCVRMFRYGWDVRPSFVYAHDFYLAFPGWLLAHLLGVPFVYDAHELIIPEDGTVQSRRDRFFYLMERMVIRRTDLIVTANVERSLLMRDHYGLSMMPTAVRNIAPASPDIDNRQLVLRRYPQLAERAGVIRVVYQGDMNRDRGLAVFVQAVQRLGKPFELVMVGGGPHLDDLRGMATESSIVFLGKVPREMLPGILQQCDLGIVCYPYSGLNNIYCAPNKLYEYTQAGLPVLATPQPPLVSALGTYKVGILIGLQNRAHLHVDDVVDALREFAVDPTRYREDITTFCRHHNWPCEQRLLLDAARTVTR